MDNLKSQHDDAMIRKHITIMNDNKNRSESNTHRLNRMDLEIDDLKKTYSILLKMENKIENVEDSIRKLTESRNSFVDRILDWVVPVILAALLYTIVQAAQAGAL